MLSYPLPQRSIGRVEDVGEEMRGGQKVVEGRGHSGFINFKIRRSPEDGKKVRVESPGPAHSQWPDVESCMPKSSVHGNCARKFEMRPRRERRSRAPDCASAGAVPAFVPIRSSGHHLIHGTPLVGCDRSGFMQRFVPTPKTRIRQAQPRSSSKRHRSKCTP